MEDQFGGMEPNAINVDVLFTQELFSYETNDSMGLEHLNFSAHTSFSDSSDRYSFSSTSSLNLDCLRLCDDLFDIEPPKKKRGRRPIRPNDPIKKKTEEKDKYWLRAFRAYMRLEFPSLRPHLEPESVRFWHAYLGRDGKPGKGHKFKSYGKDYKNFLFQNASFVQQFCRWFDEKAEELLSKKYQPGSDNWCVYYDYAARDLCNYNKPEPDPPSPLINPPTPFPLDPLDCPEGFFMLPPDEFELAEEADSFPPAF